MCIFKALHNDPKQQHQELSLEEFYSFYEVRDLKWKKVSVLSMASFLLRTVKVVTACISTPVIYSIPWRHPKLSSSPHSLGY